MPYLTVSGGFERASRTGHANAVVRAAADRAKFFVPAEHVPDAAWLSTKTITRTELDALCDRSQLESALAIDGSRAVVGVRDGVPSVRYGYAQASAAYLNLEALEAQRAERFVDPVALNKAVTSALVSLDLPVAGAYTREGISIQDSWRESMARIFELKRVEVNGLDESLQSLLLMLHGRPGQPAESVPVRCWTEGCPDIDVAVPPSGAKCQTCSRDLLMVDTLRIQEEVVDDGSNETALGRLMQVVELLVLVGLATLLWEQARDDLLATTLFIVDGPLAVYGPPAKLNSALLSTFRPWVQPHQMRLRTCAGLRSPARLLTTLTRLPSTKYLLGVSS